MTEVGGRAIVILGTLAVVGGSGWYGRARHWWTRDWPRCRAFWAGYRELEERQALLRRPWEEDLLHWSFDGQTWHLHGHLDPPLGRRRSTTSTGWCPAVSAHPAYDGQSKPGVDPEP